MILDGENTFFNAEALSATTLTSDVLSVGVGEAGDPLTLVVRTKNGDAGTLTTKVQTSATEDFATPVELGEYGGQNFTTKIPRGNLGYLRLVTVSTCATGTLTAGIVVDDDVDW